MDKYYFNVGYNKLTQFKTILNILKIKFDYYEWFYCSYMFEYRTTPKKAKQIEMLLNGGIL